MMIAAAGTPVGAGDPITDRAALDELLNLSGLRIAAEVDIPGSEPACPVVAAPGGDLALSAWASLRSLVPLTGRYPLIAGGSAVVYAGISADLAARLSFAHADSTAATDLAAAECVDPERWFAARADYLELDPGALEATGPLPQLGERRDPFMTVSTLLTRRPLGIVEMLLLPTRVGWETPAHLDWGGWNDAPGASDLVALLRRWCQIYDAHVVAMTDDVIEVLVGAPPSSERAAIDLAREQFLVAPDIVWQGCETLTGLAAELLQSPTWYFWWD